MLSAFYLRGVMIGFSIAAPVGPIGVLAIRRTLTSGWLAGLLTGLGAATADAFYGCVAGFGLTAIADWLIHAVWLRWVGGCFLCYLGIRTLRANPAVAIAFEPADRLSNLAYLSLYGSTVLLTLTNPATILSFAAVFVGLGLATGGGNYWTATQLVAGVFSGSALWWLLLSIGASRFRSQLTPRRLQGLNQISGLILLTFGIIALSSAR